MKLCVLWPKQDFPFMEVNCEYPDIYESINYGSFMQVMFYCDECNYRRGCVSESNLCHQHFSTILRVMTIFSYFIKRRIEYETKFWFSLINLSKYCHYKNLWFLLMIRTTAYEHWLVLRRMVFLSSSRIIWSYCMWKNWF